MEGHKDGHDGSEINICGRIFVHLTSNLFFFNLQTFGKSDLYTFLKWMHTVLHKHFAEYYYHLLQNYDVLKLLLTTYQIVSALVRKRLGIKKGFLAFTINLIFP